MYEFLKEITSSGRMRLPGLPMCWCHSWHFWVTQKWQGQRLGADLLGSCAWYSRAKTQQMWPFENVLKCRYRGFKCWYCLYPTTHAWASKQEIQRMTKYKKMDGRMEDKLWKDRCKEVWICSQFVTQKEEAELLDCASSAANASFYPYADMSPSHREKCKHYHSRWCPTCHVTAR